MGLDPLQGDGGGTRHWTTSNLGEAIPGVMTPLCWTVWDGPVNRAVQAGGEAIGAIKPSELERERSVDVFCGRAAFAIEVMATIGDRMPGTSGEEVVRTFFDSADLEFRPTKRRYPVIAVRAPAAFLRFPRQIRKLSDEMDAWWRASMPRISGLDRDAALAVFVEARARFDRALCGHIVGTMAGVQPAYEALKALVAQVGVGDLSELSSPAGAVEMELVIALWRASRGEIDPDAVAAEFGFHGPHEGELSSHVWREDDRPLRKMIAQYALLGDECDPRLREAERRRRRPALEAELLEAIPARMRPVARLILRGVRERVPLRGVGKRALVQSLDVVRSSARRLGALLAHTGRLENPEDVFYLTADELVAQDYASANERVAERRDQRAEYNRLVLPEVWTGDPVPQSTPSAADGLIADVRRLLNGVGASAGSVVGTARVVTDPAFAEVENGEILVAPTTDPSWASIMYVSAGLVVDIGGPLSHAAVVAREIGIPCVVGARGATQTIVTGDRIRVDGDAGTVEVLASGSPVHYS